MNKINSEPWQFMIDILDLSEFGEIKNVFVRTRRKIKKEHRTRQFGGGRCYQGTKTEEKL